VIFSYEWVPPQLSRTLIAWVLLDFFICLLLPGNFGVGMRTAICLSIPHMCRSAQNVKVDAESWIISEETDRTFKQDFNRINITFDPFNIDLLVSSINIKCQYFVFWFPRSISGGRVFSRLEHIIFLRAPSVYPDFKNSL